MNNCQRKRTNKCSELESERMAVKVGKNSACKDFTVPKEILCRSEWFKAALRDNQFREGQSKIIELPEDTPEVFEIFLYFLYNECITFPELSQDTAGAVRGEELVLHSYLWAFGDKYLAPGFQSCVIFRLCYILRETSFFEPIPGAALETAYRNLKTTSPIRTLIGDYIVTCLETISEYRVPKRLAQAPGFFQVLHKSEAAFHSLPKGDFPRQLKPKKFAEILKDDTERMKTEDSGDDGYVSSYGVPSDLSFTCEECGYPGDTINVECKQCKSSRCNCSDPPQWAFRCNECVRTSRFMEQRPA